MSDVSRKVVQSIEYMRRVDYRRSAIFALCSKKNNTAMLKSTYLLHCAREKTDLGLGSLAGHSGPEHPNPLSPMLSHW